MRRIKPPATLSCVDRHHERNQSGRRRFKRVLAVAESPADAANIVPHLPLMRYRLRFHVGDAQALQDLYLGSAWRGAFGRALRRSACITNLPRCDDCALLEKANKTRRPSCRRRRICRLAREPACIPS